MKGVIATIISVGAVAIFMWALIGSIEWSPHQTTRYYESLQAAARMGVAGMLWAVVRAAFLSSAGLSGAATLVLLQCLLLSRSWEDGTRRRVKFAIPMAFAVGALLLCLLCLMGSWTEFFIFFVGVLVASAAVLAYFGVDFLRHSQSDVWAVVLTAFLLPLFAQAWIHAYHLSFQLPAVKLASSPVYSPSAFEQYHGAKRTVGLWWVLGVALMVPVCIKGTPFAIDCATSMKRSLRRSLVTLAVCVTPLVAAALPALLIWLNVAGFAEISGKQRETIATVYVLLSPPEQVLMALLIVIAIPVAEELFFRGYVQRQLMLTISPLASIGLASVLFAVAHGSLWYAVLILPVAVWLGLLGWWARHLAAPIAAHMLLNAVFLVGVVISSYEWGNQDLARRAATQRGDSVLGEVWPLLFGLVPLALMLLLIRRRSLSKA